ncbi:hypothetical protein CMV14_02855 [Rhizorhabdus dicambivorans]|nr:hypothetical protein [Rhizorhabdus dicambivorans]ATE63473.1 hypothetical protein CMV14_02855 [Rhizorhabdus dicambivorans]
MVNAWQMAADPFAMLPPMNAGLEGLWTLRFGRFGCRDEETHGGILHIEEDRMAGGDGHFLFHGGYTLDDGTLSASLQAVRHGAAQGGYRGMFDTLDATFRLEFTAEALSPGQFEGRIRRDGGPDLRVVMRRFEPLSQRSRIV